MLYVGRCKYVTLTLEGNHIDISYHSPLESFMDRLQCPFYKNIMNVTLLPLDIYRSHCSHFKIVYIDHIAPIA